MFSVNLSCSWPPLIFSSVVYSEGKWGWVEQCSGPVMNLVRACSLPNHSRDHQHDVLTRSYVPMNVTCKLELVALRDWSQEPFGDWM